MCVRVILRDGGGFDQRNSMLSPLMRWVSAGSSLPTSPPVLLVLSVKNPFVRSSVVADKLTTNVEAAKAGLAAAHTTSSAQRYTHRALRRRVLAIGCGWPFYDPWGGNRII